MNAPKAYLLPFVVFAAFICTQLSQAHAKDAPAPPEASSTPMQDVSFEAGLRLQQAGKTRSALQVYEALADRGEVDAALSYNRGIAYLQQNDPELLGQAAAALIEAELLGDDSDEQAAALRLVQDAITKQTGSQKGNVVERITLSERVLRALSPLWLFVIAAITALVGSVMLLTELRGNSKHRFATRLTSGFSLSIAFVCIALQWAASALSQSQSPAVVTAKNALILDETGRRRPGYAPLASGSLVYEKKRVGHLSLIAWQDSDEIWVQTRTLRSVAQD